MEKHIKSLAAELRTRRPGHSARRKLANGHRQTPQMRAVCESLGLSIQLRDLPDLVEALAEHLVAIDARLSRLEKR